MERSQLEQVFATEAGAAIAGPTLLSELRAKRVKKAAEVAASLIKLDANNPLYLTLLGVVDVAQRDYPGAEAAFRAALGVILSSPLHATWRSSTLRRVAWTCEEGVS
jgi:predicted Zn-dependent protease